MNPSRRCPAPTLPLALLGLVAACDKGTQRGVGQAQAELAVVRVSPADVVSGARPALLNEALTVHFSAPLDTHTVHEQSFRVVDDVGHAVRGRVDVRRHSVTFVPEPPLQPDLTDGSFAPDRVYTLEVAGFPAPAAIRGESGQVLSASSRLRFRTVGRDPGPRWPSPLLPVGFRVPEESPVASAGDAPEDPATDEDPATGQDAASSDANPSDQPLGRFEVQLQSQRRLVPAGRGTLRLSFTLPVLPTSLSERALRVFDVSSNDPRAVPVASMRLMTRPVPLDPYPGCTLELTLAPDHGLQPGALVLVASSREAPLLDYAGRPLQVRQGDDPEAPLYVSGIWHVVPGDRIVLAQCPRPADHGSKTVFRSENRAPGWRVDPLGRLVPQVFAETGAGSHRLEPERDLVLEPGRPVPEDALRPERADGAPPESVPGVFHFHSVRVPEGVTVTVRATEPVEWRVLGGVEILGTVRLETPAGSADLPGFRLVAGGFVSIGGAIETADPVVAGTRPAVLESGTGFRLHGRVPPSTELLGNLLSGKRWDLVEVDSPELTPAIPEGARFQCEGWSPWVAIPAEHIGATLVRVVGATPGVTVAAQLAAPDPTTLGPPRGGTLEQPRPVRGELRLEPAPGSYLRFLIRAEVVDGAPLPRLDRIELLADS